VWWCASANILEFVFFVQPGELLDSEEAKKVKLIDPGEVGKLPPEEFKKLKQLLKERKKILTVSKNFVRIKKDC